MEMSGSIGLAPDIFLSLRERVAVKRATVVGVSRFGSAVGT